MRLLGGAKLAVVLIGLIGIAIIAATFNESSYGAKSAYRLFYGTWWFEILIGLLGVNVLTAALNRFPWRWSQAGFLMTHVAILVIIFGSMLTRRFAIEGTIQLRVSEQTDLLEMEGAIVSIMRNQTVLDNIRVDLDIGLREGQVLIGPDAAPATVRVLQYWPNSRDITIAVPAPEPTGTQPASQPATQPMVTGVPAVKLVSDHKPPGPGVWLFAGGAGPSSAPLGRWTIAFAAVGTEEELRQWLRPEAALEAGDRGTLVLDFGRGVVFRVPVAGNVGKDVPLGGGRLKVRIREVFSHVAMVEGKPVNRSDEFLDPAVTFDLVGPDHTEPHVARLWQTHRTHMSSRLGVRPRYDFPAATALALPGLLVLGPNGELHLRLVPKGGSPEVRTIEPGEWFRVPWSDAQVKVAELILRAVMDRDLVQIEPTGNMNTFRPAMQLRVEHTGGVSDSWLTLEDEIKPVQLPNGALRVYFGRQRLRLGFKIRLDAIRVKRHPGMGMESGYESTVTIIGKKPGDESEHTIGVNRPLRYGGFTLYQTGMTEKKATGMGMKKQAGTSTLTVARDPGTPYAYVGFALLIVGTITALVQRRIKQFRAAGKKWAAAERIQSAASSGGGGS